jgi:hypothetical protein
LQQDIVADRRVVESGGDVEVLWRALARDHHVDLGVNDLASRVPKNSAPLGQTVAHMGLRPVEVRS